MPLVGFLSVNDPGRISTITTLMGDDRRRRKKIFPLLGAELPPAKGESMYMRVYVRDCLSHEPRGAVVPVDLKRMTSPGSWEDIGTARCCPLCWSILIPPDKVELPPPVEQPILKQATSKAQKASLKKGRKRERVEQPSKSELSELIRDFAKSGEEFTEQDIRDASPRSRTAVRFALKQLVAKKELVITERGKPGRGAPTKYQSA